MTTSKKLTSVRVNGRVAKINYRPASRMPDIYGQFNLDEFAIDIRKGLSPFETRDTVLHEIFHAILFSQGREYGGEVEELFVRALATGLTGVLQDNPDLANWLFIPPTTPEP